MNHEKNNGTKSQAKESLFTTDEKAQYQVFKNGELPKETIAEWIRNDLQAIMSFVHGMLKDEYVFGVLVNAYYERYKALHQLEKDKINDKAHEPQRTSTK